jgi:sec-independent protein translocase protein TatA
MDLGWQELVIILVVVMIIFGAGKLPERARSLGQGVKAFKDEANSKVQAGSQIGTGGVTRLPPPSPCLRRSCFRSAHLRGAARHFVKSRSLLTDAVGAAARLLAGASPAATAANATLRIA